MPFGVDIPNLPLSVILIIILSFLSWSKFFHKKQELIPDNSNQFISVTLIFSLLLLNYIFALAVMIYSIQTYLYISNYEIVKSIIDWLIIPIFLISVYFLAKLTPKDIIKSLNFITSLLPAVTVGFALPVFVIFTFITSYNLPNCFLIFVFYIVLSIVFLYSNHKVSERLLVLNEIDKKNVLNKNFIIIASALFFIMSIFLLLLNFSAVSFSKEVRTINYDIPYFYSEGNPFAYKNSDTYYSVFISPSAKKIVLKLDSKVLSLDDETKQYFGVYLEKNRSIGAKIIGYDDLNKELYGNISYAYVYKNLLTMNIQAGFRDLDFDHIVVRGGVKQNISGKYQIFPLNNWDKYYYDDATKTITINFSINNSLDLENNQLGGYIFTFSSLGLNGDNCTFGTNSKNIILKLDKSCGFFSCSDWVCNGECGNWSINLQKDNNRVIFSSQNRGEMGLLEVKSHLYCK